MRFNNLQKLCRDCEHRKLYGLDMGGNHVCTCRAHQLDYFNKRTDKCDAYKKDEEYAWYDKYKFCIHCGNSMSADAMDGSQVLVCFNQKGHEHTEMQVDELFSCENYN